MKSKRIMAFVIMLILTAALLPASAFAAKPGVTEVRITGIFEPVGGETANLWYSIPPDADYQVNNNQWIRKSDLIAIIDDMTFTAGEEYFRSFSLTTHGWFDRNVKVFIDGVNVSHTVQRSDDGKEIFVYRDGYFATEKLTSVNAIIKNFKVGNKLSQVEIDSADSFRYCVTDFSVTEERTGEVCKPNTVLKNVVYLVYAKFIPQPGYTIRQDTAKYFNGKPGYTPGETDSYIYMAPEAADPKNIKEVSLTVKAPSAGEKPGRPSAQSSGYTVAASSWEPVCNTFDYDKVYSLVVTVEAKDGFCFTKSTAYKINGQDAKLISSGADQAKFMLQFPATEKPEPTAGPETSAPEEPTAEPEEPTAEPDEPTTEPDEPTAEPDEPTAAPDEPTAEPEEPSAMPEKPNHTSLMTTAIIVAAVLGVLLIAALVVIIILILKRRKR